MTGASEHEPTAAAGTASATERRDEIREALEQDNDQATEAIDSERREARAAQDRTDIQRRDARDTQDRIDEKADTQRRDARDTQEQAETVQDNERQEAQNLFDARRDGERRDAFEQNVIDRQHADELEESNQNLEAFAYLVSYDLRAPLRAMNGCSAALLEDYGPSLGEGGRGYAERIKAASQWMSELIDALLCLARLSRSEIHLQPVDLGAEAAALTTELQASEPGRSVQFTIQQPAWAMADPQLIRTVLENLLGNAWKFTSGQDNASIELGTTPEGDTRTRCYIADNGVGFDPAQASKLFSPFQRLSAMSESSGTGTGTGTGVGLASVRKIIERHGGQVGATAAPGEGATFSFTLATTDPPA